MRRGQHLVLLLLCIAAPPLTPACVSNPTPHPGVSGGASSGGSGTNAGTADAASSGGQGSTAGDFGGQVDAAGPPAQGTDALLSDIAAEDGAGDSGDSGDCEVSEGAGCPSLGDDDALGDAGPPGR